MRFVLCAALSLGMGGCGYVGDPQPPALHIPMRVEDLKGVQRGSHVELTFTPPKLTTEILPVVLAELDVRYGVPQEGAFQVDSWADSARRMSVPPQEAEGPIHVDIPIADLAGREVFLAVRSISDRGRASGWSNVVALTIASPLPKPVATATAIDSGVQLASKPPIPEATGWRVFRKTEEQPDFQLLAEPPTLPYIDATAAYGKLYRYRLQATRTDSRYRAESEISDPFPIIPEDRFAPPVPAGLTAIAGIHAVELAWDRSAAADLQGYRLYRATAEGDWAPLGELATAPSFSDGSAQPGVDYRYAVTAVDVRNNESARSEPVTARLPQ